MRSDSFRVVIRQKNVTSSGRMSTHMLSVPARSIGVHGNSLIEPHCWSQFWVLGVWSPIRTELPLRRNRSKTMSRPSYSEIIPIVRSHLSTSWGHSVIGKFVGRNPNAWPPCAYRCISTGTPAFLRAM